jgi:phosphate starvation-inducible PhoH-like protein
VAEADKAQTRIVVPGAHQMVSLLGQRDELLQIIERAFRSDIHVRGNEITITGEPAENAMATRLFEELIALLDTGDVLTSETVGRTLGMLKTPSSESPVEVLTHNILSSRGRTIRPKTLNQKRYVDAIDKHTIVFGIGPAGTGKTYLAMAKAVQALQAKAVNRIILTRPGGRGRRAARLPARHAAREDRPLPAAAVRRAARHARPGVDPAADGGRHHRGRPLAYMRGRAMPVQTPVMTPRGWRAIGSLSVGDLVTGSNGLRRRSSGCTRRASRMCTGSRRRTAPRRLPAASTCGSSRPGTTATAASPVGSFRRKT